MPIEIKELIIRTVVGGEAPAARPGDDHGRTAAETSTEEIVQECVRQVLRVLQHNKER